MKGRMFYYPSFFRLFRLFPFVPYSFFNMAIGGTVKFRPTDFSIFYFSVLHFFVW